MWDALFGHTVKATEVAFFGNGDAEIVVLAGEGIGEEGGEGSGVLDALEAGGVELLWRRFDWIWDRL